MGLNNKQRQRIKELEKEYKSIMKQNSAEAQHVFENQLFGLKSEEIKKDGKSRIEYILPLGNGISNIPIYACFRGGENLSIYAKSNITIPQVEEKHFSVLEIFLGHLRKA